VCKKAIEVEEDPVTASNVGGGVGGGGEAPLLVAEAMNRR